MSLARPKPQQKRLASQMAWERGQKIERMPETSSALAGLMRHLDEEYEPLPVTEGQLEEIAKLTKFAEERVTDWTERRLPIVTRTDANKELFRIRTALSKVAFNEAKAAASEYLVARDDPTADSAETPDAGDTPF